MKTPKARKLPSGAWFCRVRINGQDIPITRPTEKEAVAEAMAIKAGIKQALMTPGRDKTLTRAIDDYIDARRNVLSPSTIRGYRAIQKGRFQDMMHRKLSAVTPVQWQQAVNREARECSAKTLTNSWRFISSVIYEATEQRLTVRLPQIVANERPYLTAEQILVFVDALKGTAIEIPALLALSSLRRSELLDLQWKDVDLAKGVLRVTGAAVLDENAKLVHKKETKNKSSRRTVPIIPPLQLALESAPKIGNYIVTLHPDTVYKHINQLCLNLGFPQVGLHGLRHSFASLAHHLNWPEKITMEIGGWNNDQTMRKIYTHLSKSDIEQHASQFTGFFNNGNAIANGIKKEQ